MKLKYIILGRNLKKIADGFSGSEKGDWTIYKMFYEGENNEYGEFYLNINERTGVANIALKDADYCADLVTAFTRSLAGDPTLLDQEYNDPELNDMREQAEESINTEDELHSKN